MLKIAVLVSGGGTNLQALIDAQEAREEPQRQNCAGGFLQQQGLCAGAGPSARHQNRSLPRRKYATTEDYDRALLALMREHEIDLIVLAGFMCILGSTFTRAYDRKIVNVHPSLIPSFCGDGFYGLHVHEAALAYGVKVTGATVHFVNEVTDGGQIIMQKAVEVLPDDTPETLQRRVMEQAEWEILPRDRGNDLQRRDQVTQ